MPDQPTVIIHNHAGGESKPPGREVGRYHHPASEGQFSSWIWHPGSGSYVGLDFVPGRTYVVYELDD